MNEVLPQITVDWRLGELLDDIDFDYEAIIGMMRDRGFTNEQISQIEINISNLMTIQEDKNNPDDSLVMRGLYNAKSKQISLYPHSDLIEQVGYFEKLVSQDKLDEVMAEFMGKTFSDTLVHELEHYAVRNIDGGMAKENIAYFGKEILSRLTVLGGSYLSARKAMRDMTEVAGIAPNRAVNLFTKLGAASIAVFAVTHTLSKQELHGLYLDIPEEIHCRETSSKAPGNLVMIRAKLPHGTNS